MMVGYLFTPFRAAKSKRTRKNGHQTLQKIHSVKKQFIVLFLLFLSAHLQLGFSFPSGWMEFKATWHFRRTLGFAGFTVYKLSSHILTCRKTPKILTFRKTKCQCKTWYKNWFWALHEHLQNFLNFAKTASKHAVDNTKKLSVPFLNYKLLKL